MKEDVIYLLEKVLFELEGELINPMTTNICARLKGVLRDVKRYL